MTDLPAKTPVFFGSSTGLELVPDAVLEFDGDGVVVAANDSAARMFLCTTDELRGRRADRLFGDPEPLRALLDRGERAVRRLIKVQGRRANGVPFPLELSLRVETRGQQTCALCVLRELDYGGLVHEASRYFDIAFDQAPIGMAIFNADGEYVRVNPALCELLGRGDDQLLGRRDQEFTHPDDRQLDVDVAWDILAGRRSTFQRQKRFVRPDGAVVWAIANLTFLRDERGRPLNWVGQFQDITALRRTPAPE
jgi:PAS domain S-box-containing protein